MKIFFLASFLLVAPFFVFSQTIDSADFYVQQGLREFDSGRFSVAAKNYEKAIQIKPGYTEAYYQSGKVNLKMNRIYQANENFQKAYSLSPGNEEVIKELTYLAFNNHQYQKAIDFCLKCKKCGDADRILGISFYYLEDYAKSTNYLEKFVSINDKDAEAAYVLGRSYLELENEKQAINQFKNAIALDPKKNKWMNELGLIYYNQEDYKNALLYFNMASENGFNKTNDFYENYGFAQIYTGDSKNGIETLEKILERKPNNTELLRNMAHALYSVKDYQSSLSYFERLLKINEKDASALFMAGMIFQKTGEKEKGQKICDKAIELDPSLARNRQKKEMPMGL
jgi:tetratricopeptide (TPR) repeat protein